MLYQTLPPQAGAMQHPALVKQRVQSIDLLRGLVMILMALDHTRDFTHVGALAGQNPLELSTTSTWLFFTRWITHICAPSFVFLSGTSAFFMSQRKTKQELSIFLVTRGLWLIFLELTILAFAWGGVIAYNLLVLNVIWVLGLCMILLAPLIYLPKKVLFVIGMLLVFGHNFLDRYNYVPNNAAGFLWSVLHEPHSFDLGGGHTIRVVYAALPWLGIMIMGYLFGLVYQREGDNASRKKILILLGTGCILLFIVLRFAMLLWSGKLNGAAHQESAFGATTSSILLFIKTNKYPPSVLFTLMTIGPALLFLAFAENIRGRFADAITVFGRVPLFYYILHLFLIHGIAWIIFAAQGYSIRNVDVRMPQTVPDGVGVSLGWMYAIWLLVIFLLYWPCKWYNEYKSTHKDWWLSYL
ncbi:MAG TPA: heparan-alpha-glucosaminide N-acetyltransferase domain-containing protein [Flavisolibacter sp.]|nr:heparan-alpha-glucosaminide N-acetyltransferase domain-containing protein [Flavisolibacter sp.]